MYGRCIDVLMRSAYIVSIGLGVAWLAVARGALGAGTDAERDVHSSRVAGNRGCIGDDGDGATDTPGTVAYAHREWPGGVLSGYVFIDNNTNGVQRGGQRGRRQYRGSPSGSGWRHKSSRSTESRRTQVGTGRSERCPMGRTA